MCIIARGAPGWCCCVNPILARSHLQTASAMVVKFNLSVMDFSFYLCLVLWLAALALYYTYIARFPRAVGVRLFSILSRKTPHLSDSFFSCLVACVQPCIVYYRMMWYTRSVIFGLHLQQKLEQPPQRSVSVAPHDRAIVRKYSRRIYTFQLFLREAQSHRLFWDISLSIYILLVFCRKVLCTKRKVGKSTKTWQNIRIHVYR